MQILKRHDARVVTRAAARAAAFTILLAAGVAACSGKSDTTPNIAAKVDSPAIQVARSEDAITPATGDTIEVWKDPSCGCCKTWIEYMQKHGFTMVVHDTEDLTSIKQAHGVGADLVACHTATIHGYTIEGHVPADAIRKLIAEKPDIAGLAVPGMPMGSPGMESGVPDHYDVIAFKTDGTRTVYASM